MTTPKDIKGELVDDLEATDDDAEGVKGGVSKVHAVKDVKAVKDSKASRASRFFKKA